MRSFFSKKRHKNPKHKLTTKKISTTGSLSEARWYHKLDTPLGTKTVVRNAVGLVPPTAYMIILQKVRFVNSSFYTIFQQKFRQKRYTIEKNDSAWH